MQEKRLLYEISIIRPLVILLLVVYHCLCLFTGGWRVPEGVDHVEAYWWMGKLISGFRIECIAFVGGYVMAYQMIERGRDRSFLPFVWKKLKRLMIPCILFGALYWMLFRYSGVWNWHTMTLRMLGGIGHLWFLPMLFWCFVLSWLIIRVAQPHKRPWLGILLLTGLAVVSMLPNPKGLHYGLTQVNHFLFYFYMGGAVWLIFSRTGHGKDHSRLSAWSIVLLVAYLVLLVVRLKMALPQHWPIWWSRILKWGHMCSGIMALYLGVMSFLARKGDDYRPKEWLLWCSNICYGVYVLHCFFLQWLYYFSPMPQMVATWLLPWAAFVITMAGSVGGAWLLKRCGINIM